VGGGLEPLRINYCVCQDFKYQGTLLGKASTQRLGYLQGRGKRFQLDSSTIHTYTVHSYKETMVQAGNETIRVT